MKLNVVKREPRRSGGDARRSLASQGHRSAQRSNGEARAPEPTGPVSARLRVTTGGRVKLAMYVQRARSARMPQPKRPRLDDIPDDRPDRPDRPPRPKRPERPAAAPEAERDETDDGNEMICTWLQCDRCAKWRIVPEHSVTGEGESWFCEMNLDLRHNHCDVPQQPDDAVADFTMEEPAPYVPSSQSPSSKKQRGE